MIQHKNFLSAKKEAAPFKNFFHAVFHSRNRQISV